MTEAAHAGEDRILLVEDDGDARESLGYLLELRGFRVLAAANGREALRILEAEGPPCLILLDLMMPVMDGWAFRDELLRHPELARIPVVLLSGADDVAREAQRLRAVGYVAKPVNTRRMFDLVETYC